MTGNGRKSRKFGLRPSSVYQTGMSSLAARTCRHIPGPLQKRDCLGSPQGNRFMVTPSPCQARLRVSSLSIVLNGPDHPTPSFVVGLSQHRVAKVTGNDRKWPEKQKVRAPAQQRMLIRDVLFGGRSCRRCRRIPGSLQGAIALGPRLTGDGGGFILYLVGTRLQALSIRAFSHN